jgi:hypothetical protein
MTTQKFTIGATAFVLAIAGAFATKASNKVKFTSGFTFNGASASSQVSCATRAANQVCRTQFPNGRILYTASGKVNDNSIKTLRTVVGH